MQKRKIIIGISGASGTIYGIRLLETLKPCDDIETHLVMSDYAKEIMQYENNRDPQEVLNLADKFYPIANLGAAISSGSFLTEGMIIAPCSIKSLSGIANSYNDNLLVRAADVCLKERRKLIIVLRETPLHLGHLELMTRVTRYGATLLPPIPSFYHNPKTIDDLINQTVGKVLDNFGISHNLFKRWQSEEAKDEN
ncbi:MAG: UbiX family flavin prenyltransferase [Deltaproteobacteria bacterium]|nr:UbiX family flavin prenyltransferase [Deltaproteobacteria bacterium]